jgi:hypothetical protein
MVGAVAALVAAWYSALDYRRGTGKEVPVVEATLYRRPDGLLAMPLCVRNRSQESLEVLAVRIRKPRGALIGTERLQTPSGAPGEPVQPKDSEIPIKLPIWPMGVHTNSGFPTATLDEANIVLYVNPPSGWKRGKVHVRVSVTSTAGNPRARWYDVLRSI